MKKHLFTLFASFFFLSGIITIVPGQEGNETGKQIIHSENEQGDGPHVSKIQDETLVFPVDTGKYIGPSDLALDVTGQILFVAEYDAKRLRQVRVDGSSRAKLLPLEIKPEKMQMFRSGNAIALVGGESQGRLIIVDTVHFKVLQSIPVGHYPCSVAVDTSREAGKELVYVSNRFGGDISVVDLAQDKEVRRVPCGREPISIALTPSGKKLIILPHQPEDKAVESAIALNIRIYETETDKTTLIPLRSGTTDGQEVVITPDGRYAFLSCVSGHFENVPTHVDGGWMVENMLAVIDMETNQFADTLFLDDFGHGAGNPWGMSVSPDSKFLAVAIAGNHELTLFNLAKVRQILDSRPQSARPGLGAMTATYLQRGDTTIPTRMRIPVELNGVRQVVVRENRIYFTAYFEDSIGRIDATFTEPVEYLRGYSIDPKIHEQPVRTKEPLVFADDPEIPLLFEEMTPLDLMKGIHFDRSVARLGPAPELSDIRLGNQLFHDATICYEHWQSCTTCHPDGRSDCINWDLLNDGIGNPKNTKSMVLSHETPPAMISGVRKDAETAVRSGIKSILFASRPESDARAIDAYLKSLKPVPSPRLKNGLLNESAVRGKILFNSPRTGCSVCHPAPYFTDMQMHDVGTRMYRDTQSDFDTPTLVEVWRTSPYLHDGRYITIKELVVEGKHVEKYGQFEKLSEQEIDDLIEYVLSL